MQHRKLTTLVAIILLACVGATAISQSNDGQLTEAEAKEARELAAAFIKRFEETRNLSPLIDEFYFNDSVKRFIQFQVATTAPGGDDDVFFISGVGYNSQLHTQATLEDWRRFYVAAYTFMHLGFALVLSKMSKDNDINPDDIYPREVIKLLEKNKNLSNMIQRREGSPPIRTVAEMRAATIVLEQAVSLIREQQTKNPPERIARYRENFASLLENPKIMKPVLLIEDKEFFGFPPGTRLIEINTQAIFKLFLAKQDGKLKIVWATLNAD